MSRRTAARKQGSARLAPVAPPETKRLEKPPHPHPLPAGGARQPAEFAALSSYPNQRLMLKSRSHFPPVAFSYQLRSIYLEASVSFLGEPESSLRSASSILTPSRLIRAPLLSPPFE